MLFHCQDRLEGQKITFLHFRKNVVHHIGDKGCKGQYNQSAVFQQLVTLMTALVFVPADEVIDVWMNVIEPFMARIQDEIAEEMDNFIDYFVELIQARLEGVEEGVIQE